MIDINIEELRKNFAKRQILTQRYKKSIIKKAKEKICECVNFEKDFFDIESVIDLCMDNNVPIKDSIFINEKDKIMRNSFKSIKWSAAFYCAERLVIEIYYGIPRKLFLRFYSGYADVPFSHLDHFDPKWFQDVCFEKLPIKDLKELVKLIDSIPNALKEESEKIQAYVNEWFQKPIEETEIPIKSN